MIVFAFLIFTSMQITRYQQRIEKSKHNLEVYSEAKVNQFIVLSELCQHYLTSHTISKYINFIISNFVNARTFEQTMDAYRKAEIYYGKLFEMLQKHPDFTYMKSFITWHDEFVKMEEKRLFAKEFYNDSVTEFNKYISTVPWSIVANLRSTKPMKHI